MNTILKQSTEIKVRIGPFVDATDGVSPETGITLGVADQAELLKANGAATVDISGATWAAVTGADGWYDLTLTTSHTDTLGEMEVVVQDSSVCLPVFAKFNVVPANMYDSLVAGTDTLQADVTQLGGATQSATDLKDFADDGYDPATNKVQGVVLVDTVTALSATALDAIVSTATGMVEIAKAVWDRVLSAATHNIATSAGRRLRNIQDFGIYDLASVWVDEVNGTSTGTTAGEDATVTNRATDFDNAQIIAAAIDLDRIYVSSGNSITLTGPLLAYNVWGFNYSIALGGQDVSGTFFDHATISGIGTGTDTHIHNSEIGTVTIGAGAEIRNSGLSGTLTLGAAGDYELIDCVSLVAGVGTPTIDMDAALGASNLNIRRWSGGLTLSNIGTGDVVSIDGITGGTVTLTMTGGTVEVRGAGMKALVINGSGGTVNVSGFFGTITDNSGGAITVADTWALNRSIVNSECDTALTDYGANTTTPPTVAAIADAVWDETDTDHATADTFGGNLQNAVVSGGDATEANQTTIITHLTDIKGATFNGATDSLEEIRDRGDAAWITGGAGSGAITFTYTLTDADTTDPIPDALVAVYSDVGMTALVAAARTDVNGQAVFSLDAGTYYLRRTKAGYNFTNPDTEVVA